MNNGLVSAALHLARAYGARRVKEYKDRLVLNVISLLSVAVFALIGLIFLFVLAFTALAQNYDPATAALILVGVAVAACVIILSVRAVINRQRHASIMPANRALASFKSELPSTLALGMALGKHTRNLFTAKRIALLLLLAAGVGVGSRPLTVYRYGSCMVRKLRGPVKPKFRSRFW